MDQHDLALTNPSWIKMANSWSMLNPSWAKVNPSIMIIHLRIACIMIYFATPMNEWSHLPWLKRAEPHVFYVSWDRDRDVDVNGNWRDINHRDIIGILSRYYRDIIGISLVWRILLCWVYWWLWWVVWGSQSAIRRWVNAISQASLWRLSIAYGRRAHCAFAVAVAAAAACPWDLVLILCCSIIFISSVAQVICLTSYHDSNQVQARRQPDA